MESAKLTSSQIKYLLTIKKVSEASFKIRSLDIAIILGVAKSSVHKMMDMLKSMDFIRKEHYGEIYLTDEGRKAATKYEQYYFAVLEKLAPFSNNDEETENAILAFLSELSSNSLNKITQFSNNNE